MLDNPVQQQLTSGIVEPIPALPGRDPSHPPGGISNARKIGLSSMGWNLKIIANVIASHRASIEDQDRAGLNHALHPTRACFPGSARPNKRPRISGPRYIKIWYCRIVFIINGRNRLIADSKNHLSCPLNYKPKRQA